MLVPRHFSAIIHNVVPLLWRFFENQVSWPSIVEWNYRPEVEPKWEFYSGHRHYHLMNTQLIVYSLGNIVFLQAGFLGSMNDAGNFHLMERIVPGTNYDMPHDAALLADKGYGDVAPLLTPFRAAQIRRMTRHHPRLARRFNHKMSKCRIIVEHTIKHLKTYRGIGTIWRHPRWFQPFVVELCTFLAQRHVVLFYDI